MLISKNGGYQFTNFTQLESVLNDKVREALEITKEMALDELIRIIDKNVYGQPEGWYNRTEELKDRRNWVGRVYKGMKGYTLEINFEPNYFTYDTVELQHTNSIGTDVDPLALIGILNGNGGLNLDTNLSRWGIEHKAFWDEFEWWFHDNFTEIFKTSLETLRLNIQ